MSGPTTQVRAQRDALGEFLATVDDWDHASLCTGWRVRDVVAHCVQSHVATPWRLAGELIAAGFRLTARNDRWIRQRRSWDRAELLNEYQTTTSRLGVPTAELPYALVETVIHGYDIAWPLGRSIEVPADCLVIVAETCRRTGLFLGGKQRCAGLTLRATDVDWSAGSGPEVTGPLASIIMAVTGRPMALETLSGKGLSTLTARL